MSEKKITVMIQARTGSTRLPGKVLSKIENKKVDVLFGGIVCKGFSLAGVRNPFDPRNYLYQHQLRLVNILKPKVSIIENVTAIKNMMLYINCEETIKTFQDYTELIMPTW